MMICVRRTFDNWFFCVWWIVVHTSGLPSIVQVIVFFPHKSTCADGAKAMENEMEKLEKNLSLSTNFFNGKIISISMQIYLLFFFDCEKKVQSR